MLLGNPTIRSLPQMILPNSMHSSWAFRRVMVTCQPNGRSVFFSPIAFQMCLLITISIYRHSGMQLVNYGLPEVWQANMQVSLLARQVLVEVKKQQYRIRYRRSLIMVFSTYRSDTHTRSLKSPTWPKFTVVSLFGLPLEKLWSKIGHSIMTGSPWGAGTYAASDGSRQPSALELEIASIQGKAFYETVSKVKFA